ncbi:MAG: SGNH hydrolase domain-containing protein [Halioglobus sp.]
MGELQCDQGKPAPITGFLRQLAGSGKTVYVSSKPPQFLGLEGLPIVDWFIRQKGTLVGFQRELAYRLFVARLSSPSPSPSPSPSRIEIDAELRSLADALGLHYLDLGELVCDTPKQVCHAITDDGYKVYFDILHWTLEGSGYLGLRMAEAGWFPDAGRTQKQ